MIASDSDHITHLIGSFRGGVRRKIANEMAQRTIQKIGCNRTYARIRPARPSRIVVTIFFTTKKFANAKRTSNVA
jgi:hypothetical protein